MSNNTDKELLMLAAKAAGLIGYEYVEETDFTHTSMQRRNMGGPEDGFFELQADVWSPLTDDGDALRLAVKLEMDIQQYKFSVEANAWFDGECIEVISEEIIGQGTADYRLLVTRRAIVRAAAAIGSKL